MVELLRRIYQICTTRCGVCTARDIHFLFELVGQCNKRTGRADVILQKHCSREF